MKKISTEALQDVINILGGSSHPTMTFNQINNTILFLTKLEEVVETPVETKKK